MVQKGALRLQQLDHLRNVLEPEEGLAVLLDVSPNFFEGLGVAGEEGRELIEVVVNQRTRELVKLLIGVYGIVEEMLEEIATLFNGYRILLVFEESVGG